MVVQKRQCLICSKIVRIDKRLVRGLCPTCYDHSWKAVRSGKTTWDVLIEHKMALPSHRGSKLAVTAFAARFSEIKSKRN